MAWWTQIKDVAAAAWGDSNVLGSGGFEPPGGQRIVPGLRCYASSNGQLPYSENNLGWYELDPNGPARVDEYLSHQALGGPAFIGQLLGGNGNSPMQAGATFLEGSRCDTFNLYQSAVGGTTMDYWANGHGWTTLARTMPAALASMPGSPDYFQVMYIGLGGNDLIQGYTVPQVVAHYKTLRKKLINAGWWRPGLTQVLLMDMPHSFVTYQLGFPGSWNALAAIIADSKDNIALVPTIGADIEPSFPVHFLPPSQTAVGVAGGEILLAGLKPPAATVYAGASRVVHNGARLVLPS